MNEKNNDVTPSNDKYEIENLKNKDMDKKSVESFDMNYKTLLEISTEREESEQKTTNRLI